MSKEDEVLRSCHAIQLEKLLISRLCIMGSFFTCSFFLSFSLPFLISYWQRK